MSSVKFSHSVVSDSLRPHGLQHFRLPCPITNSMSLLKLMSIESVIPSRPLLPPPPALFPSIVFFWSFSFSISSSNEYLGLIFFRIEWFDLLAVQGTLKSLLRHHSSKASILRCSAFFIENFIAFLSRKIIGCWEK